MSTNLTEIVQRLRAAAGPDALIVGTTYPDVILGAWVSGNPSDQQLATLSVTAFKSLINPTLQKAYQSVGGQFVDVTAATGAYGPMTDTTTSTPTGSSPSPWPRSATSPTTARSTTSIPTRTATRSSPTSSCRRTWRHRRRA